MDHSSTVACAAGSASATASPAAKHHGALFAIFPQEAVAIEDETRDCTERHFCPRFGSPAFRLSADEAEATSARRMRPTN